MRDQCELQKILVRVERSASILIGSCFVVAGGLDVKDSTASRGVWVNATSFAIAGLSVINTAVTGWRKERIKMMYFLIWVGTFSWAGTNDEATPGITKKWQQITSLCSIFLMWIDSVRRYKSKNYMVNAPNFIFLFFAASSGALQLSYQFFQKIAALHLAQAIFKISSGVFFIITAITQAASYSLKKANEEPRDPLLAGSFITDDGRIRAVSQGGGNACLGSNIREDSTIVGDTCCRYQGMGGAEYRLEMEIADSDEEATESNDDENAKEEAGNHNSEEEKSLDEFCI